MATATALLVGVVAAALLVVADASTIAFSEASTTMGLSCNASAIVGSTCNVSLDATQAMLSDFRFHTHLVEDGISALGRVQMVGPGTSCLGSIGDVLTRTTASLQRPKAEPAAPSTPPVLPPASPPAWPFDPTGPGQRKSPPKRRQPVLVPTPPSAEPSPSPCAGAGAPPPPPPPPPTKNGGEPSRSSAPVPPPPPPPASPSSSPPLPVRSPAGRTLRPPPPPPPPPPPGPDGGGEVASADAPFSDLQRVVRAFLKAAKALCKQREIRQQKKKSRCSRKKPPRCINIYQNCN